MSVRDFYEVKMHSNERHPLFYFISFTTLCCPHTDIVFVHIVYIHETHPSTHSLNPPIHPFLKPTHPPKPPPPPLCDAVGGAFLLPWEECDHLPEAGNNYLVLQMQNPCRRQAIYIMVSIHVRFPTLAAGADSGSVAG